MPKFLAYRSVVAVMTNTPLASLANAARAITSSMVANGTNLDFWGDFEELVNWPSSAPASDFLPIDIYILPAPDGTNPADGSASVVASPSLYVGSFTPRGATGAQRLVLRGISLPPGAFHVLLVNNTGVALPAANNALNLYPYQTQA